MSSTGALLKAAREAKSLSLDEIASATRINKKYLLAIEEGKPIDLPDLYLQAFIKDYAMYIGVELGTTGVQSSPEIKSEQGRIATTVSSQVTTTNLPGSAAIRYPHQIKPRGGHQFRTLAVITFIVLSCFVILLFWIRRDDVNPSIQEVTFSDIVKQQATTLKDSLQSPFMTGDGDSAGNAYTFILEGTAVESVWVRVVIDGTEIKEYTLLPLGRIRCEGKQYFELSMDNARGIIFTVNGKRIGTLSQIKKPLWNVTVAPTTIERLQKMAGSKE